MMGAQAASAQLFYDFCLDDHVPSDHLPRSIDGHLDFEGLRQTLKPFYSQIGRPSIELMIRMLIVGYCMGCAGWPGAQRQRADGSLTDEDAGRLFADPATAFDAAYRAVAGETKPGLQTPSRAFGADSTLNFDGVVREDLNR
jgi:hypothetical protein